MNTKVKLALAAGLMLSGFGFAASSASAMPARGLDPAIATSSDLQKGVQDAAWVCRPWGCHWVPGWRRWGPGWYGYYGYGPGWRWHRWHHWHRWHPYW